MTFASLKARQRAERSKYCENLALRVHRALSWLEKAEQSEDLDSEFIFLWIAFNAAYANEYGESISRSEQETFRNFIDRLCELDAGNYLSDLVWHEFTGSIRVLLANKYVHQPFWDYQNKQMSLAQWQARFSQDNAFANKALGHKNTSAVLSVIFSRLYTLRNQLLHGGATWQSGVNREQLRDACRFLGKFVPFTIEIMMDNGTKVWGEPRYPVVA